MSTDRTISSGRARAAARVSAAAWIPLSAALLSGAPAFAGGPSLPQLVALLIPVGPGAGDELGRSVAYREPFLVAGAWGASTDGPPLHGVALAWRWEPGGWVNEAMLIASDRAAGDRFGGAVAVSRPLNLELPRSAAVVGAHLADVEGQVDSGAAYVFRRDLDGHWSEEAKLVPSDPQSGAQFGRAVAMDGDLIAVGAPQRNNVRGAVYLFRLALGAGGPPVWTQEAILTPTGVFAGDAFGTSVSIAANRVIAGAPGDDIGTSLNQGSAFVFEKVGANWVQKAQLKDPGGAQQDEFGRAVAIDATGSNAVIGNSPTFTTQLSAAFVFERGSTGIWTFEESLVPDDSQAGDQFASSVAFDGTFVVAGAPARTVDGDALRGAAFLFNRTEFGWLLDEMLVDPDGVVGDSFGTAVSISGEGAVIGAKGADLAEIPNAGALLVEWIIDCNTSGDFDVCHTGDPDINLDGAVNGDDLGTLLGLWGAVEPYSPADLNGDGWVDGDDLGVMLGGWTG